MWTALESSAEVVSTQELALELARESVAIAQVSYENGVITSAELNDAQVSYANGMVADAGQVRQDYRGGALQGGRGYFVVDQNEDETTATASPS